MLRKESTTEHKCHCLPAETLRGRGPLTALPSAWQESVSPALGRIIYLTSSACVRACVRVCLSVCLSVCVSPCVYTTMLDCLASFSKFLMCLQSKLTLTKYLAPVVGRTLRRRPWAMLCTEGLVGSCPHFRSRSWLGASCLWAHGYDPFLPYVIG